MGRTSETVVPPQVDRSPPLGSSPRTVEAAQADVQRLAQAFAVTPEAVGLAVARVETDFRDLQRELGGRR